MVAPSTGPLLRPFAAIRPDPGFAQAVAARPYDVVTYEEAKTEAAGRPWSFLHVSRAEIDLPDGADFYGADVYAQAAHTFATMIAAGILVRDPAPQYYAYRMRQGDHVQTGIAAAATVADYEANRIRRHEHTRPEKERDRARQIKAVAAHTGPVLAAFPPAATLASVLLAATEEPSLLHATTSDGTRHDVWPIAAPDAKAALAEAFTAMPAVYIADGHHRSAAAARVYRECGAGDGVFLVVAFPADELRILGYNRIIRDLAGLTAAEFLGRLEENFIVEPAVEAVQPASPGSFGLILAGRWYRLTRRTAPAAVCSPGGRLDVRLLSERVLEPILGIVDPRVDPRIDFVGGGRGLEDLERRVRSGDWSAAFSLYPTTFADVIAVADAGEVMPPKSTWFEPKLADGLLSLPLSGAV